MLTNNTSCWPVTNESAPQDLLGEWATPGIEWKRPGFGFSFTNEDLQRTTIPYLWRYHTLPAKNVEPWARKIGAQGGAVCGTSHYEQPLLILM